MINNQVNVLHHVSLIQYYRIFYPKTKDWWICNLEKGCVKEGAIDILAFRLEKIFVIS
jgi:hypothetical protein